MHSHSLGSKTNGTTSYDLRSTRAPQALTLSSREKQNFGHLLTDLAQHTAAAARTARTVLTNKSYPRLVSLRYSLPMTPVPSRQQGGELP